MERKILMPYKCAVCGNFLKKEDFKAEFNVRQQVVALFCNFCSEMANKMKAGISKEQLKENYAKHKAKINIELANEMIEAFRQGKDIEIIKEEDIKKGKSIDCCELRQLFREVLST